MTKTTAIQDSQKMVKAIAKQYYRQGRGYDFLDLVQEGNIGLLIAFDKFDPERGVKFQTYGAYWIRQKIQLFVFKKYRSIEITFTAMANNSSGIDENRIDRGFENTIKDPQENYNPEIHTELQQILDKVKALSTVEQEVLYHRALGNTLEEIGDGMDYTRERIRQIQRDAVTKIKSACQTTRRQCTV